MDNIAVFIKQVPDTNDIKWTKENNISREGMLSILNPYDQMALYWAIKLKEETNAKITVVSMGPKQAREILEYAYAIGADEAYLLCDKAFAASDTLATGRILSYFIKSNIPNVDLILCGQMAIDGDTAQTGATIANLINIEHIPYVIDINFENKELIVKQEVEDGFNIIKAHTPILLSVQECSFEIVPKISDYISAQEKTIKVLGLNDLGINKSVCGILGSPTFVSRVFRKVTDRKCEITESFDSDEFLTKLKSLRENV